MLAILANNELGLRTIVSYSFIGTRNTVNENTYFYYNITNGENNLISLICQLKYIYREATITVRTNNIVACRNPGE